MSDIEAKALALVNDCGGDVLVVIRNGNAWVEALCRAIEQHEAFKQEVSDAVQSWVDGGVDRPAYLWFRKKLEQFIIPKPKPDPLVEVLEDICIAPHHAKIIRAALDALGFEIREKGQ